ncbi:MAG: hypothetical protein ACRDQF_02995 [Thermocrispum sp.]
MNRTPLPEHLLKRSPYNQLFAIPSLALFLGAYTLFGGVGFLVTFGLWSVGLISYGRVFGKRSFQAVMRQREQDETSHRYLLRERAEHAEREGMTYAENSAELAATYGRVEQDVPENTSILYRPRARHTAELTAEGVVRGEQGGFPCTVFDLTVVNEVDLRELRRRGQFDMAVECAKEYLTVCAVTLPIALPYLSAQAAWENSYDSDDQARPDTDTPSEQRHSDDPEFARLLLSVPAVREAAVNLDLLWVIRGDQLIASKASNTGLGSGEAFQRLSALATLGAALPWDRLEPYRRPDAAAEVAQLWGLRRSPLLAHQWWNQGGLLGESVLRWGHQPLGSTGLHQLGSVGLYLGERPSDL